MHDVVIADDKHRCAPQDFGACGRNARRSDADSDHPGVELIVKPFTQASLGRKLEKMLSIPS